MKAGNLQGRTWLHCNLADKLQVNLVPEARLELARYCYRRILNPLRLPFRHSGTPTIS